MLDRFNDNFEWTLHMNLKPQVKRVATKYFEARVYAERCISVAQNGSSGSTVSVAWEGLESGQDYSWYVRAEDSQGSVSVSEIRSFIVKELLD